MRAREQGLILTCMKAVAIITPDPKYLVIKNARGGTLILFVLAAAIGRRAPMNLVSQGLHTTCGAIYSITERHTHHGTKSNDEYGRYSHTHPSIIIISTPTRNFNCIFRHDHRMPLLLPLADILSPWMAVSPISAVVYVFSSEIFRGMPCTLLSLDVESRVDDVKSVNGIECRPNGELPRVMIE